MKILYIGYFSEFNGRKLFCSPAANNVCTYMQDVLVRDKENEIIILNIAKPKKHLSFFRSSIIKKDNLSFVNAPSYGSGRVFSLLTGWMFDKWVKKFISRNLKSNDCVIFYHSLNTLKLENFIAKNFNSILQVEEIYSEVYPQFSRFITKEYECVNCFKKHVFVSDAFLRNDKISSKSSVVLYGSYSSIFNENLSKKPNTIIYSGNISKFKGIFTACDAMKYLPDFELHIYAHGSNEEYSELKKNYSELRNIFIHNTVSQNELEKILNDFSIGINPLPNEAKFNDLTFPSKILMYLKAGLYVVSTDLKVITGSPFSKYIDFCEGNALSFANKIKGINQKTNIEAVKFIKLMDSNFERDLFGLIKAKQ